MAQDYRLFIDARERHLAALFGDGAVAVMTLDAGDVRCEYTDGTSWILERKTATDLAKSIKDGRWAEQKDRLLGLGQTVFIILEGNFRNVQGGLPYGALLGAYVNTTLLDGVHAIRTVDLLETKYVIMQLAKKCDTVAKLGPTRGLVSKRKKDSDVEVIWVRQLSAIPTFSEHIANTLLGHFGTMTNLREALRDPRIVPVNPLSRGACLGRARIDKLAEVLL